MDLDYNNLIDELIGGALLNAVTKECDPKEAKQIKLIVKIFQKHGMTMNEAFQIIMEMSAILGVEE